MDELKNLNPEYFEQLSLGLEIDENEDEGGEVVFTTEEKARRSFASRQILEKMISTDPKKEEWFATFQRLMESNWPWRVACYVAWASSPKYTRWPQTQDEFAKKVLGLTSDRVIATWRKKSPDIDGAVSLLQSATMLEHRADVIKALVASASSKDHRSNPDRKLFFEMTGDYTPRSKVDIGVPVSGEDLSQLSEAQLMEIARRNKKKAED